MAHGRAIFAQPRINGHHDVFEHDTAVHTQLQIA
jgi:hypothetical protein